MPNCLNTYAVKPEQSNPSGDDLPQAYGVPRYYRALAISSAAVPDAPPPAAI